MVKGTRETPTFKKAESEEVEEFDDKISELLMFEVSTGKTFSMSASIEKDCRLPTDAAWNGHLVVMVPDIVFASMNSHVAKETADKLSCVTTEFQKQSEVVCLLLRSWISECISL